jgi:hypothetical protein
MSRVILLALRELVIRFGLVIELLFIVAIAALTMGWILTRPAVVMSALSLALLSGCMSVPFASDMTEGQLNALAADDKTRVKCYEIPTPYGRAKVAVVYMDKDTQHRGSVIIEGECKVTVHQGVVK